MQHSNSNEEPLTLQTAIRTDNSEEVRKFIESSTDVNEIIVPNDETTPLLLAAFHNQKEICGVLLDLGANIEQQLIDGSTALHLTCFYGYDELCKLLISYGADINKEHTQRKRTPLCIAIEFGYPKVCNTLINSGADLELVSGYRDHTPLQCACFNIQEDVVAMLIKKGVNVNYHKQGVFSPLAISIRRQKRQICEMLIDAGVDVNEPSGPNNLRPLQLAWETKDSEISDLLVKAGADFKSSGLTPDDFVGFCSSEQCKMWEETLERTR